MVCRAGPRRSPQPHPVHSPQWLRGDVCQSEMLTPGTLIATDRGWCPVEQLCRGDRVVTRDNGLRRVVWAGRQDLSYDILGEIPALRPVLIRQGAFGAHTPRRDMLVSPHQRFSMLPDDDAEQGVFHAAWHMRHGNGVETASVLGVSYLHLLLDAQQVILADGAWVECFHPDDAAQSVLAVHTRAEVLALFPEIATQGAARPARPSQSTSPSRFER